MVVHLAVPTGPPTAAHVQRAGFVVSGGVGNSVVRHRVQRRLRAAMAHELDRLPPGALVVVRALPGSAELSYGALSADLGRALRRAVGATGARAVTRGQDSN